MNQAEPHPAYVELDRAAWAELAAATSVVLNQATIEQLRGIGDPTDEADVQEVFHPLTELISQQARQAAQRARETNAYLGLAEQPVPFIVGIAGSVAVGKSTVARLVAELLRRSHGHPKVALVTTDGFLYDNSNLSRRGLLECKGFPQTYDTTTMLGFVMDVKAGCPRVVSPLYSHVIYDIVAGQQVVVEKTDILVLEGLNVLQPASWPPMDGQGALAVSDFIDFSVYVDADEAAIREWFVQRFLQLRSTAFTDPSSFFRQYAILDDSAARAEAQQIWDEINGLNLRQFIAPTKPRATVILRKDANHRVKSVQLRVI